MVCAFFGGGLIACSSGSDLGSSDGVDRAAIDIGDLRDGGRAVQSITMPDGYVKGDKVIAYEGPGWESDRVAYRLYLDGRNAVDIFGKRTPELVLSKVGRGDDYHTMAEWGMDILKVGNSLGAGGFGVLRDGKATQIGDAAGYSAEVISDTDSRAQLRVTHTASDACGGDVVADYTIEGGSRLTDVKITGDCALPFVAGLVVHPDTLSTTRNAVANKGERWSAIMQSGKQTLSDDELVMAIFFRPADVMTVAKDEDDHYIAFRPGVSPHYKFGAAWAQEPQNDTGVTESTVWMETELARLNSASR